MTIFGDGTQLRAFTHIDDVAPIIARSVDCSEARNEVFNIGADEPHSVNDLARIVADAMGLPCNILHLDTRNEVKVAFSDHSKAERVFGGKAKKSLSEGVAAMAAWVQKHGARESSVFNEIEVLRKMPASWAKVTPSRVGV